DGTPLTAAERRSLLRGWITATFDGPTIIASAIRHGRHDLGLRLTWTGMGQRSTVAQTSALKGPTFHRTDVFTADGQWQLELSGSAAQPQRSARLQGWVIAGIGEL